MSAFEVNFDGLVGPTHNYAGLSPGNVASTRSRDTVADPKAAALQGLEKMKSLADLGLTQAVLPPHARPNIFHMRKLGFGGPSDNHTLQNVVRLAPELLPALYSASNMWVANAATISPYPDSIDGKTHITPANLSSMFHRSMEAEQTAKILKTVFSGDDYVHHPPLPAGQFFADEGAANHTRLCLEYGQPGVEFFVYGTSFSRNMKHAPVHFPARQYYEASAAIARLHGLNSTQCVFAQQNPEAIDAGVFHNDVIAVGNQDCLFYHEQAFLNQQSVIDKLSSAFEGTLHFCEVPTSAVSLNDAVSSYLFNAQLIRTPNSNKMTLIAPIECQENLAVKRYLDALTTSDSRIGSVHYLNLKQSMKNGGGPACLRLRVVMSALQIQQCKARVFLDTSLYKDLRNWIEKHYRSELSTNDLYDPNLLTESYTALDELCGIMNLGAIYDFQTNE